MPVYYFETSALAKRYFPEMGSGVVSSLFLEKTEEDTFITSRFTSLEIEAIAARALKAQLMTPESHGAILNSYAEDLKLHITVIPFTAAHFSEALKAIRQYTLRAGDAIHLAASIGIRELLSEDVTLVTSDRELYNAGEEAGLTVINPTAEGAIKQFTEQ